MPYLNINDRTTGPTPNEKFQPLGRSPALFGVFMGFVKRTDDIQKMGRLQVWIPEFGSAPENEEGWTTVSYCSPFAGATNVDTTSKADKQSFEGTQTSYGMWMVPPDINNQVLIMFVNGDTSRGVWIGSLFNQFMNNMVPGVASAANSWQYPGKQVPVAEYNKWDTTVTQPDRTMKPYEKTKFKGIGNQGLLLDSDRGTTSSSARRESPSSVFGILTPGPAINSDATPDKIRRKGGSSFIMDDATGSEYVQLSTKSGSQIKIDETNGFVYLINRDGTAWVQMDKDGNIDIFGAKNISMRAQRDINFRADRNINIEAGQNIFIKAAKDTKESTTQFTYNVNNTPSPSSIPVWKYVGEGKGQGGNIVMHALNSWHNTTQKSALITVVENNLNIKVGNSLNVTTITGGQNFKSSKGIKLSTDGALDITTRGNIRAHADGSISVIGVSNVAVCTDSSISLNAGGNIINAAAGAVSIDATNVIVGTSIAVGDLTASSVNIGGPPASLNTIPAEGAIIASSARAAEVKPLNNKLNILATWKSTVSFAEWQANISYKAGAIVTYNSIPYIANKAIPASAIFNAVAWSIYTPEDKFVRNSQSVQTIVSKFPTYEPCPEHANFNQQSVNNSMPVITPDDITYPGSAGVANSVSGTPPAAVNPGATNTGITGDSPVDSNVSKDINMDAFRCQLIIHEGLKAKSYTDSKGLVTGGIGHLLRANEVSLYPVGSPISADQIESWYTQDSSSAIKISQELLGSKWADLTDIRKRATADLAYNLGKGGLSKFVQFLAYMKQADYTRASQALTNSTWFTQVGKRGPNIVSMILNDVDPNGCDKKFPG